MGQHAQLIADIRSFEAVASGATEAVVELSAKLVNDRTGCILAARVFSGRASAVGIDAVNVTQAFNGATDQVLRDMVIWATGLI